MQVYKDLVQGTKEWHEARAWLITGTRLERVMSSRESTRNLLMEELIAEKVCPLQDVYQSDAMERWHLIESVVKELYTKEKVDIVWFVRKNDYVGLSPDGIIYRGDDIVKGLEVKGPLPKNLIKYWMTPTKIPEEYFWQVVHYFIVIDTLEELDFVIHNPDPFDKRLRTLVITVTRKELETQIMMAKASIAEFQVNLQEKIKIFIKNIEDYSGSIEK